MPSPTEAASPDKTEDDDQKASQLCELAKAAAKTRATVETDHPLARHGRLNHLGRRRVFLATRLRGLQRAGGCVVLVFNFKSTANLLVCSLKSRPERIAQQFGGSRVGAVLFPQARWLSGGFSIPIV